MGCRLLEGSSRVFIVMVGGGPSTEGGALTGRSGGSVARASAERAGDPRNLLGRHDSQIFFTELRPAGESTLVAFRTTRALVQFLPCPALGCLPRHRSLGRLPLRIPTAGWLIGKRTFRVAPRRGRIASDR
jgi:hypothetical protein